MANYVNNRQLLAELIKYKAAVKLAEETGKTKPQIPRYVAESIMLIAEKLSYKPSFAMYTYREEMVSDGILACVKYIDSFDPVKYQNPFAYITQIVYNAFINRLNVEHKQRYVKAIIVKNHGDAHEDEEFTMDSLDSTITSFESKMQRRKEKAIIRNQKDVVEET